MTAKGNIEVEDGHIKVRWLLSLARGKAGAEDKKLLPENFPRFENAEDLAHALGATKSDFSNWFPSPDKGKIIKPPANRPRVEAVRNVARIFGFAPDPDEDDAWPNWWKAQWASFMPSEDDNTNHQQSAPAELFLEAYREALANDRLKFRLPTGASATPEIQTNNNSAPLPPSSGEHTPGDIIVAPPLTTADGRQTRNYAGAIVAICAVGLMTLIIGRSAWNYLPVPTIEPTKKGDLPAQSVDLVRNIDFTALTCDAKGNKHDVVNLVDDFTVVKNADGAKTFRREADLVDPKYAVEAYDLNVNPNSKVLAIQSASNHEHRVQSYAFAVRDSHVKIKWVWTDTHSNKSEGTVVTAVPSPWTLRNLTVNYTFSPGRRVTDITKLPPGHCTADESSISCTDLNTSAEVQIWWDWNVWDGCSSN
jgi:hypothetical protein